MINILHLTNMMLIMLPTKLTGEPQATGQQQQNYQQRHLSQQYGPVYEKMSPNINQQAPSPSDYLAAKQQQQQKPQLNRVSQHSSPDQNMQQNLHRQISNGQEVNQRRLSSTGTFVAWKSSDCSSVCEIQWCVKTLWFVDMTI